MVVRVDVVARALEAVYGIPAREVREGRRVVLTEAWGRPIDQGYVNAFAGIALPNDASVGLHEACGFQYVGVFPSVGFKLESWHDVGWWHRRLTDPPTDPQPPRAQ